MHDAGILVPILICLGAFAMVFGIVYLRTRENMALIDKGKDPRAPRPYRSLKSGLLLIGAGVGLLLAILIEGMRTSNLDDQNPFVYFALIAVGGGTGLILSYAIERKATLKGEDTE